MGTGRGSPSLAIVTRTARRMAWRNARCPRESVSSPTIAAYHRPPAPHGVRPYTRRDDKGAPARHRRDRPRDRDPRCRIPVPPGRRHWPGWGDGVTGERARLEVERFVVHRGTDLRVAPAGESAAIGESSAIGESDTCSEPDRATDATPQRGTADQPRSAPRLR